MDDIILSYLLILMPKRRIIIDSPDTLSPLPIKKAHTSHETTHILFNQLILKSNCRFDSLIELICHLSTDSIKFQLINHLLNFWTKSVFLLTYDPKSLHLIKKFCLTLYINLNKETTLSLCKNLIDSSIHTIDYSFKYPNSNISLHFSKDGIEKTYKLSHDEINLIYRHLSPTLLK